MDAAVVLNIFQEMEAVIATEFDTLARQMPILRENMRLNDPTPDSGFDVEKVDEIEANILHFPDQFRNLYEFEMKRREASKTREKRSENPTEGPVSEEL